MLFLLVLMPIMFIGLAMAADFTRMIISARQVSNSAGAAALAGAFQFRPGTTTVDETQATAAAVETYCRAEATGALKLSSPAGPSHISCPAADAGAPAAPISVTFLNEDTTVQVTATYHVTGLLFVKYLTGGGDFTGTVIRQAQVCDPRASNGPTNGYCVRPSS